MPHMASLSPLAQTAPRQVTPSGYLGRAASGAKAETILGEQGLKERRSVSFPFLGLPVSTDVLKGTWRLW